MKIYHAQFYMYNLFVLLATSALTNATDTEHYCNFGACDEDEYCCGDDVCCNKYASLYLTLGISSGIILCIILFICLFNKCAFAQYWSRCCAEQCRKTGEHNPLVIKV